jgi:hypothetical protein
MKESPCVPNWLTEDESDEIPKITDFFFFFQTHLGKKRFEEISLFQLWTELCAHVHYLHTHVCA